MTQNYPKRLIEVDLPIKRISAHARREKSIRHGHISTLHIWWARRPLAACRAVICASLWPDPADPLCPQSFRDKAAKIVSDFAAAAVRKKDLGESCDCETWLKWQALTKSGGLDGRNESHWNVLRFALLDFIADFANWDNSPVAEYLESSRALTQAAHEALGGEVGTRSIVVDPFAGGGSIPLEALRVGADAFASDLNPVPVLLNKVVLEYVPQYGQRLADEVRKWGEWVKREAEKELSPFYPQDPDGATPIAYLWARTIRCEGPGCGAEVPLIRSPWLARKGRRSVALRLHPNVATKRISVEVIEGAVAKDIGEGTVRMGSATCPCCGYTTAKDAVREQLRRRRGGANDARLHTVVTVSRTESGRRYRAATENDLTAVKAATDAFRELPAQAVPDEPVPHERVWKNNPVRIHLYGISTWGDLFTSRQALTLATLARKVRECPIPGESDIQVAIRACLALAVSRHADMNASLAMWHTTRELITHVFGRQALPMVWDFSEANSFADASGSFLGGVDWIARVLQQEVNGIAHVELADAAKSPLPDDFADAFITDPPYYEAVPYATLSDFFYVWLKRTLPPELQHAFSTVLVEKGDEIVVDEAKNKDHQFYESRMTRALAEGRRITRPSSIGTVVFAHKATAGWEALLQAMLDAGWIITASWPIDTEMENRLRARDSAALASSVHLVCRPRESGDRQVNHSTVGDWRDVLQELPKRIHEWMPRLAEEGVVGADAIFACLGPALEIFSRYSRVEKGNGNRVDLREYLEYVWSAVAKEALTMVFRGADATGFEPDARLTAIWLWTLAAPNANGIGDHIEGDEDPADDNEGKKPQAGGYRLEYDAARKIAQGLGAVLENVPHLVEVKGELARLLPVAERTRHLFGKDEEEPSRAPSRKKPADQLNMFTELTSAEDAERVWKEKTVKKIGETTLDRIHQAMILFAAGRGEALKRFIVEDGVGADGKFWRLAQALAALYPAGSEEKRWVEGVMARKKQFGF